MKVLHLSSSLKHDESERGIYAITHALMRAGHESVVIGAAHEDEELVTRLLRDGTIYHRLPMPKKSWWALKHVYKLRQLICEYQPDIIHVHSRTPAWVLHWSLKLIAKDKHPKIVATMYGFYPLNSYSRALFNADIIITASKSIDKYLKDKLTDKEEDLQQLPFDIICVKRGIDVRTYPYRHHASVYWLHNVFAQYPELEHKKWLLFPTPIGTQYGQEWLVDILGNLQDKFPDIHAIIAEDLEFNLTDQDVSHEEFIQRIHALGLDDKVTFIGRRPPDMREWLSSANIALALANHPESIGITALQAIHLGTPVIGWAKGAFADILSATYPQGLVKEQTATALCKAVKSHLQNRLRPTMTHEYTIEQMTAETLAVYQSLMPECKLVKNDRHDNLVCIRIDD
ncbi:glycosyltransferase family 4 protein [Moraxella haemolytica]|uniref:glycosyltransferase family 4 protein n=1 Tax=Moraxella TaxID=475 RepID=UPI002542B2A3|nr:glycosyltransferase family 4 protein [Moraxella sp. ZY171148]WII94541.1 glycosyltransferase family 4 protein [Moraxella sp. ZY171148]